MAIEVTLIARMESGAPQGPVVVQKIRIEKPLTPPTAVRPTPKN
jgi:hypothetical protein